MKASVPWLRVFVEGVVIVGSILMAFGLQAWWDVRVERDEVRTELANVLSELHGNRRLVEQYLEWHERALAASDVFLDLLQGSSGETMMVPDSVVWGVGFTPTFDPRQGALNALLGSGRLALIEDPDLRGALAGFGGLLSDARDEETRARNYADLQLVGVLHQSGDVSRATSSTFRDSVRTEEEATLHTSIRNSQELVNHLARRRVFAVLSIESLGGVRDAIEDLIRRIEAALPS